jgi:hypothetical protein
MAINQRRSNTHRRIEGVRRRANSKAHGQADEGDEEAVKEEDRRKDLIERFERERSTCYDRFCGGDVEGRKARSKDYCKRSECYPGSPKREAGVFQT